MMVKMMLITTFEVPPSDSRPKCRPEASQCGGRTPWHADYHCHLNKNSPGSLEAHVQESLSPAAVILKILESVDRTQIVQQIHDNHHFDTMTMTSMMMLTS